MQPAAWNAPLASYPMGPLEVLDYGITWATWLQTNETIVGTPTIVQTDGDGELTINPGENETLVNGGIVAWWLSTPTVEQIYNVYVTIATNQGRTSTRHIRITGVLR
jgi:hypothetical protein